MCKAFQFEYFSIGISFFLSYSSIGSSNLHYSSLSPLLNFFRFHQFVDLEFDIYKIHRQYKCLHMKLFFIYNF